MSKRRKPRRASVPRRDVPTLSEIAPLAVRCAELDSRIAEFLWQYSPDDSAAGNAYFEHYRYLQAQNFVLASRLAGMIESTNASPFNIDLAIGKERFDALSAVARHEPAGNTKDLDTALSRLATSTNIKRLSDELSRLERGLRAGVYIDDVTTASNESIEALRSTRSSSAFIKLTLPVKIRDLAAICNSSESEVTDFDTRAHDKIPGDPLVLRLAWITHVSVDVDASGEVRTRLLSWPEASPGGHISIPQLSGTVLAPPSVGLHLLAWAQGLVVIREPKADQVVQETVVDSGPKEDSVSPHNPPAVIFVGARHPRDPRSSDGSSSRPDSGLRLHSRSKETTIVLEIETRSPRELRCRYSIPEDVIPEVLNALEQPGYGLYQFSVRDEHPVTLRTGFNPGRIPEGETEAWVPQVQRAGVHRAPGTEGLRRWDVFVAHFDGSRYGDVQPVGTNRLARQKYETTHRIADTGQGVPEL